MESHIVRDGNAFYEIDDTCMKKKIELDAIREKEKKEKEKNKEK